MKHHHCNRKKRYNYHTSKRYEDEKTTARVAMLGLVLGILLGTVINGVGGAILGAVAGFLGGGFLGWLITLFAE